MHNEYVTGVTNIGNGQSLRQNVITKRLQHFLTRTCILIQFLLIFLNAMAERHYQKVSPKIECN